MGAKPYTVQHFESLFYYITVESCLKAIIMGPTVISPGQPLDEGQLPYMATLSLPFFFTPPSFALRPNLHPQTPTLTYPKFKAVPHHTIRQPRHSRVFQRCRLLFSSNAIN
jgi:hypothetical protein